MRLLLLDATKQQQREIPDNENHMLLLLLRLETMHEGMIGYDELGIRKKHEEL